MFGDTGILPVAETPTGGKPVPPEGSKGIVTPMREIQSSQITEAVAELCQRANYELPEDVVAALRKSRKAATSQVARNILDQLLENARLAREEHIPYCQDTGLAVVFVELGQQVHLVGDDIYTAINAGVRRGYKEGYLRPSVVADPLDRATNTGDNTPAIVHVRIVPGEEIKLHVAAKGGGSENMSALWMLTPTDGAEGIVEAIVERIQEAGGKPCPPLILGVGIGGNFEMAALLAKEALLRPLGQANDDAQLAELEQRILAAVNATGVGPMGLGGGETALAVHVLSHPCHIASLPVALNVQCHAARHQSVTI